MKKLIIAASLFAIYIVNAQASEKFDQKLADSLGADQYGMKNYFLVILKTGESDSKITDKAKRSELFKAHMTNIQKMADEGKLAVAGPFGNNKNQYRGIFILNVKTEEEAKKLLENDPTIKEKIFSADILPWYGSAALPMYLPYHEKISKENP